MARLEFKYRVPGHLREHLHNDIIQYLNYDGFSNKMPDKEYTVRSTYFDSPDLQSYHEKLSGVRIRNKFRIRGYNLKTPESYVFVEIKRRDTSYISKDRALVLYSDLYKFLASSDLGFVQNHSVEYEKRVSSARNFLYYMHRNRLQPMIVVSYERRAFECKFNSGLRVTFDMNVRSRLTHTMDDLFDNENMAKLYPNGDFVLEVKYGAVLPSWVPGIINKYSLRKESISKYTLSMDIHMQNKIFVHPI